MPKRFITIEFPWFQNSLFCKNTSLDIYSKSQSDSFHSWWTLPLEMNHFCFSHQNPNSEKIIKSANYNDFYRYLNTYFSITMSLICSNRKPHICRGWFVWKTNTCDPSIKIPTVRNVQLNCFVSIIKLKFLSNYRYDSSNESLHRKLSVCGERII